MLTVAVDRQLPDPSQAAGSGYSPEVTAYGKKTRHSCSALLVRPLAAVSERLLRHHAISVVGETTSHDEAYRLFCRLSPDIVVMEITARGAEELETVGWILARRKTARVMIFSQQPEAISATRALCAGAFGYVTTASGPQEMNRDLAAAVAGTKYLSAEIAQTLALRDRAGTYRRSMSERETEILRLLVSGYAVTAIVSSLGLTAKTISNYQTAIKRKLGVDSPIELLRKAAAMGLMQLT